MRAVVPAALLPGHEPHRGGLLEGGGDLEKSPSPNPRNAHRSHGTGAGVGGPFGRPRLLRTPRVSHCYGSTVLTNALGDEDTGGLRCQFVLRRPNEPRRSRCAATTRPPP